MAKISKIWTDNGKIYVQKDNGEVSGEKLETHNFGRENLQEEVTEIRPKVKVRKLPLDWCIETVCVLLLLGHWFVVLSIDATLWLSLIAPTIIYIAFSILQKFPHCMNYPLAKISEQNVERLYRMGIRMVSLIKLIMMFFFIVPTIQTVFEVSCLNEGLMQGVVFALIFIVVIYYIFRMNSIE